MQNEIIIYQSENLSTHIEVLIEDETVWLTQLQMVDLFQSTRQNISLHISNIFKEDELQENSVVKYSLITASDGKKYKTKLYNLDVIISVGYRVKSAKNSIVLIDNYCDETVLALLSRRQPKVKASIYLNKIDACFNLCTSLN